MAQKGWGKCNKCRGRICSKFDSPPESFVFFLLLVGCSFHTHIQPLVHLRESDLHVFSFFSMSHFKARENESHRKTHHTWSHKKVTWKHTRGKTQLKVTRLWFSSVFGVKCDYPMLLLSFCKLLKTRVLDFEKCSLHFLTPPLKEVVIFLHFFPSSFSQVWIAAWGLRRAWSARSEFWL